jgi:flagellar biosynthesis protein FlhG
MLDQAAELRNMVSRAARVPSPLNHTQPRIVVFSGGKGGVGVTTLAINVAIALVDHGLRVVLIDADLYRADIAPLCNLSERGHVGDILSARRDIHEVLERGPGGILVVPGVWAPDHKIPFSRHSQERLMKQIRSLGRHADVVLIDVGSAAVDAVLRFWFAAHEVVLVTTPESVSVMDCYATIKTALAEGAAPGLLRLIVNRAGDTEEAQDVYRRIGQSARRFLQRHVEWLGSVETDQRLAQSSGDGPVVLAAPDSPAARALQLIAAKLASDPQACTRAVA